MRFEPMPGVSDDRSSRADADAFGDAARSAAPAPEREVIDFCVPVNPYFPDPALLGRLVDRLQDLLRRYPDYAPTHEAHIAALAGLPPACVVVGNGSTEIITALCRASEGSMVTTVPTAGRWTDLPPQLGRLLHFMPHRQGQGWRVDVDELVAEVRRRRARSLIVCNPNSPTGAWFDAEDVRTLAGALGDLDTIIMDESFIDFSGLQSAAILASRSTNLVVVKSLGTSLGWHGMKLGYAVANPARIALLRGRLPWCNINSIAAFVLEELATNAEAQAAHRASLSRVEQDRAYLQQALSELPGLVVHPSRANFVYVELRPVRDGRALCAELLSRHGIRVRECSDKIGSSHAFLRVAVLPTDRTDALVRAMRQVLASGFPSFLARDH